MATAWEYSLETETKRLIYCLSNIANGFYHINGFYPVTLNGNLTYDSTVPLPDLEYLSIPHLFKRIQALDLTYEPVHIEENLFRDVYELLSKAYLKKPDFSKLRESWTEAEPDLFQEIYRLFPDKHGLLDSITIHPTSFGTTSSFSRIREKGDNLTIYIRSDQNIYALAESVVTALIRDDVYEKMQGLWLESELITDFLITQTSLTRILQRYEKLQSFKTTTSLLRSTQSTLIKRKSDEFLEKLGIHMENQRLSMKDNSIYYQRHRLENLTPFEIKFLGRLLEKESETLSFDEAADIINNSEDDFSLYAISKRVERLRRKLEINGVSGSFIQTVRGKGYILRH